MAVFVTIGFTVTIGVVSAATVGIAISVGNFVRFCDVFFGKTFTFNWVFFFFPFCVTVTVVFPAFFAKSCPFLLTNKTFVFEDLNFKFFFIFFRGTFFPLTFTFNWTFLPTRIVRTPFFFLFKIVMVCFFFLACESGTELFAIHVVITSEKTRNNTKYRFPLFVFPIIKTSCHAIKCTFYHYKYNCTIYTEIVSSFLCKHLRFPVSC